jgi:pre-mRNA-processing factor SLU7
MASSLWGYACCHSIVHISYCTGEAGRQAAAASSAHTLLAGSGSPPEDSTSKPPPEGGGDKGKQRRTSIDVEAEQSKLAEERKRKERANDGDDRFSKKSRNEEALEGKKFDVTEDELGTVFFLKSKLTWWDLTYGHREIPSWEESDGRPHGRLCR